MTRRAQSRRVAAEHAVVPVLYACLVHLFHASHLDKREAKRETKRADRKAVAYAEAAWAGPVVSRDPVDSVLEFFESLLRHV